MEVDGNDDTVLCPLDGRYRNAVAAIREIFSEQSLMRNRVRVEVMWLLSLRALDDGPDISPSDQQNVLMRLFESDFDYQAIKTIERNVGHDVKAVELWIKEVIATRCENTNQYQEFVHFGLTSEDVNNLAYSTMVSQAVWYLLLEEVSYALMDCSEQWAEMPMLGKTHGQPATPTTMGKIFANYQHRVNGVWERIKSAASNLTGKCNGATGLYSAMSVAYPDYDWIRHTRQFVESMGTKFNLLTTQVEPRDSLAALLDSLKQLCVVLLDFCTNVWGYISLGYLVLRVDKTKVGSSTMPHKTNPILFENAEGNLKLAIPILGALATELPQSRFDRDLSDSTMMRNLGVAFGYVAVATDSINRGIGSIDADPEAMLADLKGHWELLAEPIQMVMRKYRLPDPYDQLKQLTKGERHITQADIHWFIDSTSLPDEEKYRLKQLRPETYVGAPMGNQKWFLDQSRVEWGYC